MKRFFAVLLAVTLLLTGLVVSASAEEGIVWKDGKAYYENADGTHLKGWKKLKETYESGASYTYWVYGKANGWLAQDEWQQIGGSWYYFTSIQMTTGSCYVEKEKTAYLMGANGVYTGVSATAQGWLRHGSDWYYVAQMNDRGENWLMFYCNDIYTINGVNYIFVDGKLAVNSWAGYPGRKGEWVYAGAGGALATGWRNIGGKWYYFRANGLMCHSGVFPIGGTRYILGDSGAMLTNTWYRDPQCGANCWYYATGNGSAAVGWKEIGQNKWYYFEPETNLMLTGWFETGSRRFYFGADGAMTTGWAKIGDSWYYFLAGGAEVIADWVQSGSDWYYMKNDGTMAVNETLVIGGVSYTFGPSGALVK